jgi:hypothetical protein
MLGIVPITRCREREQLEREIHKVVRQLSHNANEALKLAGKGDHSIFDRLREDHAILSERLRVLEECLGLHKDLHGC